MTRVRVISGVRGVDRDLVEGEELEIEDDADLRLLSHAVVPVLPEKRGPGRPRKNPENISDDDQ